MKLAILTIVLLIASFAGAVDGKELDEKIVSKVTYGKERSKENGGVVVVTVKTPGGLTKGRQIQYGVDGGSESSTLTASHAFRFKTTPGNHTFQFYLPSKGTQYGEISLESTEVKSDKVTFISIYFQEEFLEPIMVDKPVIYLYPSESTPVEVKLEPKVELAFTYPAYENGWKGTANPDGSFTANGKTYPYLFWEGKGPDVKQLMDFSTGSIVEGSAIVRFLEVQLTKMGLTQKEQTDFITYWAPRMAANNENFVQFVFNEECNQIAELNINPKPDHLFRVFMLWTPLESTTEIPAPAPQDIPKLDRTGFCVVEWGGSEIPLFVN